MKTMLLEPVRVLRRAGRRLGRRGTALLLFASIFFVYGYGLVSTPTTPLGLTVLFQFVPVDLLGTLWMVCAAIGACAAFFRAPTAQGAGFGALMVMPVLWCGCYVLAWVAWLTRPLFGSSWAFDRGWSGGLVWGLFVIILLLIAGWPEPPKREQVGTIEVTR